MGVHTCTNRGMHRQDKHARHDTTCRHGTYAITSTSHVHSPCPIRQQHRRNPREQCLPCHGILQHRFPHMHPHGVYGIELCIDACHGGVPLCVGETTREVAFTHGALIRERGTVHIEMNNISTQISRMQPTACACTLHPEAS